MLERLKSKDFLKDAVNEREKQARKMLEQENQDSDSFVGGGDCLELVGVNGSLTYAAVRYFEYESAGSVTIKQDISDVGGTVWDAAVILSHFIDELGADIVRDKTVIELGAGTGLPGKILIQRKASHGLILIPLRAKA